MMTKQAEESFAELFENSVTGVKIFPGAIITAKVVNIDQDYVTLTAGLKSEALVPIVEFYGPDGQLEVVVGDEVEVTLDEVEDGYGETMLSREKAKRMEAWRVLEKAYTGKETVVGRVIERVKGGFTLEVDQVRAFLPGSLVDIRPVRDLSYLVGQDIHVKVIKMDQKRNNIVVSRRAVLEEEGSSERQAVLESLEDGQVVTGTIKNLTDYGAFIDLGGIDGLLHITDISWKRVKHPSEVLEVGKEIKVKILHFDKERNRVSLGMKQLESDPWEEVIQRYPVGTRLKGVVTNITDYGCFIEIDNGVEGLVHMSEMDWTNKNINPNKLVQLGEEEEVMVLEIDQERRRISLGIKQCVNNPWQAFAEKHQKGEQVVGSIRSITDFGLFVGLEGDIDGLVHLSDISWRMPADEAVKYYKKGQEITAIVLGIDPDRERISLGIKQLEGDPFADYIEQHAKDDIVKGVVTNVDSKQATLELAEGMLGQLQLEDFVDKVDETTDLSQSLTVGDELEVKIANIDKKNRVIQLSNKEKKTRKAKSSKSKTDEEGTEKTKTTLGALLKEKITGKQE